jgi:hypothetical protein
VGWSTAYTILGNRVAPWFIDRDLGRRGVEGQLSDQPGPRFGSNVFTPRDEDADRGSHGMFDDRSHAHDPWSWASMRRARLLAGAAGLLVAGAVARRRARR